MKKKIAGVLILVLLFSGIGIGGYWYFFGNKDKREEITVGKNQNLVVAQISRINGNEITYAIAEEEDEDRQENNKDKDTTGNESFGRRHSISEEKRPDGTEGQDMSEEGTYDMGERKLPSDMKQREEETTLIPVGTTVTTQLGTTTTFARLAAGDMVKILMEKDENGKNVIVGIWMME